MKTKFNLLAIYFCIFYFPFSGFSQELVFVNGNSDFREGTEIHITLQADKKEAIEFNTKTGKINLNSFSFDSIVTLKASGLMIHEYTNQYFPKQFRQLDTIILYQNSIIYETTPRFFLKKDYDLDSCIRNNTEWFKAFLDDSTMDSTFVFEIYHSNSLSKKDKSQIQDIKTLFCKELDIPEKNIQLIDKRVPYTTERFDFFNPKTLVSKSFINQQNTPWMKSKAEEYSLVLVVEIIWKNYYTE